MRLPSNHRPPSTDRPSRQLLEGFRYVFREPPLLWPFLLILLVGTLALAWEFPITLPLLTRETFHADARVYGWFTSAMGVGAIVGGLVVARIARTGLSAIATAATVFGVAAGALAPTIAVAIGALLFVGAGATAFMSISNATMQLASDAQYRGRVMALWSVSFAGSTPIGGPLVGAVGEHASPRWALALGAAACLVAACLSLGAARASTRRRLAACSAPR